MPANIKIAIPNRLVEPQLEAVINRLALAKPNLTFIHDAKVSGYTSKYSISTPRKDAPEDYLWACRFRAEDNGAPAGFITIESNYNRAATAVWSISIMSHLVPNDGRRGSRNVTKSSNEARAIFNAKKYLVGQTYGFVLYRKLKRAESVARDAISGFTAPLRHGQFLTSNVAAQVLLHSYMTNRPLDPQLESEMRAKLDTPRFEQALAEFKLARWFEQQVQAAQCVFIHHHDDGYMRYTNGDPGCEDASHKAPVTVTQFEDLPPGVQEKLAVLQLMSDGEIVKDVGQRVDANSFWIAT
jgi:hypothetical protein